MAGKTKNDRAVSEVVVRGVGDFRNDSGTIEPFIVQPVPQDNFVCDGTNHEKRQNTRFCLISVFFMSHWCLKTQKTSLI